MLGDRDVSSLGDVHVSSVSSPSGCAAVLIRHIVCIGLMSRYIDCIVYWHRVCKVTSSFWGSGLGRFWF